ncbi:DUF3551 domain-containing protein [Bradyrhizobium sp.]|uniref:DUF3551 domain-containing protein n=1 Tax=Bradyrhizobium sp. TaxID=376 RepID=UPI004037C487
MRMIVGLAVLAVSTGLLCLETADAAPRGIQDRYCLQGRIWGYPGNCAFSTYQQCMASASGTFASCGLNPRYAYRPGAYR